ncbi:MAG TPA: GAF domain-containing sensor histidine kinase [Nocardioidaceae bacterium]|nr:GAF domain-containing sensor histidine kinase [Nocardioidaceae bacterium]
MAGGQRPTDDVADEARETLQQALTETAQGRESDVDPRRVLRGIVEAARELSAARFGALGIVGPDDSLTELIVDGLTDAEVKRIGEHPRGLGLLGELIKHPRALRIARISDDPMSHGFPPHHPTITSFLGVPVFVHARVFGILYVGNKQTADEFADSDERALVALGAAAGVAIENARLYMRSQRRGRWLEASADITRMLLERANRDDALRAVAKWARELSGSDGAGVLLAADGSELVIHEVDGDPVGDLRGRMVPADEPALARVLTDGLPTTVPDVRGLLRAPTGSNGEAVVMSALLVPFRSSSNSVGILLVVEPKATSSREDEYMLESFADQAAIALDLAQARVDSETVVVLEERDRIARDLHDVVIQRLFATGLMLQGAQRATDQPDARGRIETAVSELDTTIRDLRTAIFELHHHAPTSLRAELRNLVSDYSEVLGFAPRLSTRGPINTVIDAQLRSQLLAVLREALSNVAKHAHASAVEITLIATDRDVLAQVVDDGVGVHETEKQSGLRNLRERAVAFGGSLRVERAEPHGTRIAWRVPLPPARAS